MADFSAGIAELSILPKVGAGFASQLSHDLSGPIASEGQKLSAALSKSLTIGKVAAIGAFAGIADAAFKGMSSAVHSTEEFGHSVLTLHRQLGLTAEDSSKLVVLGQHVGVSVDSMSRAFGLFEKNLVNNTAQVQHYGLSLRDAQGNVKPFNQLLGEAADKFVALGSAEEKTAFAQNVFGRGGKDLIPILQLGAKGIAEVEAEAQKYGLVLSGANLEAIHQYALAQNDATLASQGLKVTLGTQLIPVLTTFEHALTAGLEVLAHVPGPVKAAALVTIGFGAALTAAGIAVGIVRGALANLTAGTAAAAGAEAGATTSAISQSAAMVGLTGAVEALTVSIEAKTAATLEDIAAEQTGIVTAEAETSVELQSAAAIGTHAAAAEADAKAVAGLSAGLGAGGLLRLLPVVAGAFAVLTSDQYFQAQAAKEADKGNSLLSGGLKVLHLGLTLGTLGTNLLTEKFLKMAGGSKEAARGLDDTKLSASQFEAILANCVPTVANLTDKLYANATAALADRDALLGLQSGLLGIVDAARADTDASRAVAAAEKKLAEDRAKGLQGTQQYRDDLKALTDAKFADVHANLSLKQSIASYADQLLGPVKTAQDAYTAATLAADAATTKYGADSAQSAEAQANLAAAQDALTTAEKGLAPEQQKAISQLDAMFRAAGFTKGQIADLNQKIFDYIGRVKGIPKVASTNVTAPGLAGTLSLFESLYGTIYKIKALGGIFIPVGGGAGKGSKGGLFAGYAGGAFFESPGGHVFQAGEGNYPTPLGKGGEIVNEKGVMPLDDRGRRAVLEASGFSAASVAAIKQAFKEALWEMRGEGGGRSIELVASGRNLKAVLTAQDLWDR